MKRSAKREKPIAIDLCCGVGGLSLGFSAAGYRVAAAVDIEPINVDYHHRNHPECVSLKRDLAALSGEQLRKEASLGEEKIEIVFGGPPCQGFSLIGKRMKDDPRSKILGEFLRVAIDLQPKIILMENVPGLALGQSATVLEEAKNVLVKAGYASQTLVTLNAKDFGVPQSRKRLFLVATKSNETIKIAAPTELVPVCVKDAIGSMTSGPGQSAYVRRLNRLLGKRAVEFLANHRMPSHSEVVQKRFAATPQGKAEPISRYHRLAWSGCSPTLRAGTLPDKGSFMAVRPIHPEEPRCISVREAARLHSYPDSYEFHESHWHGFRQIGNSVPPLMAYYIAKSLLRARK